mmetsp:Transcript_69645/g.152040  ORF Transcript_69645/g.152040 Transcript_69645/m.152040 type:complete len:215 (+) Transcript_69645:54-698(+)|eukprot:CAMPEP_0206603878 /NCGR_PEP_ID=MMETSP0325_2-20121206/48879_1 /ASSEMBLY_ACC=CAM_ASM_000347 /TAXON_ID=2866 /ORGANISM="Crypthecodinium cohnii, Strain Seligo" /LENGTH=214 /DNA_ID=CAMNT_0054117909 /DNA_START=15 /DNA_END=659 /DNA_ORIENTATION=-
MAAGASGAAVTRDEPFELHFLGELDLGELFPDVSQSEGLCVDYAAHAGPGWLPIAKDEGFVGQTQTAYADAAGVFVFSHPIELHYMGSRLEEWPQLHLQVLKLDAVGRIQTISFGSVSLPTSPGHSELVCRTWAPVGASLLQENTNLAAATAGQSSSTLLAARAEILSNKLPEERSKMVTKRSGIVRLELDTIFRNAEPHRILMMPKRGAAAGA